MVIEAHFRGLSVKNCSAVYGVSVFFFQFCWIAFVVTYGMRGLSVIRRETLASSCSAN